MKPNLLDITGKRAFVSGGTRGIGLGIAELLAEQGAEVAIAALHDDIAEQRAAQITEKTGSACIGLGIDVTSGESIEQCFAMIAERFGSLDIAINNAGVGEGIEFLDIDETAWDRVLDTNLKGVYRCCKAEIPLMLDVGGSIVNVASISGSMVNVPNLQAHYNTSKAAVIMLSRSLASEFAGRRIRVNTVSPGYTLTDMNRRPEVQDLLEIWKSRTPVGRLAEVKEIAGAALYLASDLSTFVTGHDLVVDGGITILC